MEREQKRLEQFRLLRKEIRGSQQYLVVGIDISKDTHNALMRTVSGKILYRRLTFNNTREGFETLLLQVEAVQVQHGLKEVVFGMEPTANYHKPLGEFLINQNHQVVLISPEAAKQNRPLLDGRWNKHDGKDCANIADLMCQGKCLYYEYPSPELRDLRNLLSLNRKLKKLEQGLRLRIRNHLVAQYFPELDQYCHWGANEGLALVRWCLDPAVMAALSDEELIKRLGTPGRTIAQRKRLSALKDKAPSSIGCQFGDSVEFEGQSVVKLLKEVRQAMEDAQEQIQGVCQKFKEYSYLLSIPGFGPTLSAMVLGAIGNPWRFQNGAQVLKMVGLDLSASQSGKSQGVPIVSKKGKAEIRYALYQAATVASSRDKHFVDYFTDQLRGREKEKGIKTKKRVKLAAKMLMIAWTLMKKHERFDPKYLSAQTQPIAAHTTVKTRSGGIPEVQPAPRVVYRANMKAVFLRLPTKRTST
jgi:transposase